ncbi:MAG: hypothetical protein KGJ36_00805 [Acidobacteriota bacterium]|nr:hypothetical protein [Acidobacteriota bacterium]
MTRGRARRWRSASAVALCAALAGLGTAGAATTTTVDPGRLPQTRAEPSTGAPLTRQMTNLWRAIVRDDVNLGHAVFFPESAYVRMKTGLIPDPAGDYINRLVGFYTLDLSAYHDLVTRGGPPTLVRVAATRAYAAWIPPGYCENRIGYWHLPGVRLVYLRAGRLYSVAAFSLISWRGVWYVVHLGPNPRPRNVGTVFGYSVGPGVPGPPGGC